MENEIAQGEDQQKTDNIKNSKALIAKQNKGSTTSHSEGRILTKGWWHENHNALNAKANIIIAFCSVLASCGSFVAVIIATKSLNLSNKSLQETQKEFTIANEPYLQFEYIVDSNGRFYYSFLNYGKFPILIEKGSVGMHSDSMTENEIVSRNDVIGLNRPQKLVTFERPFSGSYILPNEAYNHGKNGVIFMSGYLIYKVVPTGKTKRYTFQIRVQGFNANYPVFYKDEYIN